MFSLKMPFLLLWQILGSPQAYWYVVNVCKWCHFGFTRHRMSFQLEKGIQEVNSFNHLLKAKFEI